MDSEARFERIERTLEFLADNQARFDGRMPVFDESLAAVSGNQALFDTRMSIISDRLDRISTNLKNIVRAQQGQRAVLDTIIQAQQQSDRKMAELIEKGNRTEQFVQALIKTINSLISRPAQ